MADSSPPPRDMEGQQLRWPTVKGYQILDDALGQGGFSRVYRAIDYDIGFVVACKVVLLDAGTTTKEARKSLDKEIKVHASLKHRNIIAFYNHLVVEDDGTTDYVPAVYMLLELASGGDLFDKIVPDVGIDDELSHYYFTDLVQGVTYMHNQGVCHRDLKPENILLDAKGRLKISDFGLCAVYKYKGRERLLSERCGSMPYIAPELLSSGKSPYKAEPIDIWGVGIILFTFLVGNTPWDEPSESSPEWVNYTEGRIFKSDPWNRIGRNALDLLKKILAVCPDDRPSLQDIASHPWCIRQSQLVGQGSAAIAERLSRNLRKAGHLELAEPNFMNLSQQRKGGSSNSDEDSIMLTAHATQFTQTLQLFSQTQSGPQYNPHLTRFYATVSPLDLQGYMTQALARMGHKYRIKESSNDSKCSCRIGGVDRRKEKFRGWIHIEGFEWQDGEGSRCIMQREKGDPMEWRRLWKEMILSDEVDPVVLRKRDSTP